MTPRITPWSARWRRRVAVGRRNVTRVIAWWCDECRRCSNIVYCFLSIDFHAQIASQTSIVGTPHRGAAGSAQGHRVHGPISARSKPHPWGPSRTGSRTRIKGCPCPEKVCRMLPFPSPQNGGNPRPAAPSRRPRHHEGRGAGERHSAPACATHPASVGRGHLALGARLPRHPPRGWRLPPPSFPRIVATGEAANVALVQHKDTSGTVRSRRRRSRIHGGHRAPGRECGSKCALVPRKCAEFSAPPRRWPWRGPI